MIVLEKAYLISDMGRAHEDQQGDEYANIIMNIHQVISFFFYLIDNWKSPWLTNTAFPYWSYTNFWESKNDLEPIVARLCSLPSVLYLEANNIYRY